jgi:hypothetical protein
VHRFLLVYSSFAIATIVFSAADVLAVAGAPAIAGIHAVAGAPAIAGIHAVASAPAVVGVLVINVPAVVGGPAISGISAIACVIDVAIIVFSVVVFSADSVADGTGASAIVGVPSTALVVLLLESLLLLLPGCCRHLFFAGFLALTDVRCCVASHKLNFRTHAIG